MLTIQDCIAFSTLTPEEVDAIAEIEHLPEIIAVELAAYLMTMPDGTKRIGALILEDLNAARRSGDAAHVARLKLCLQHFVKEHAAARSAD